MRPGVIDDGGDATPSVHAQRSLEGVVIRVSSGFFLHDVKRAICEPERTRYAVTADSSRKVRCCNGRLIRLIDIPETKQPVALGPYVPNLERNLVSELLLEIEVVVLHVGRANVAINREDVALEIAGC